MDTGRSLTDRADILSRFLGTELAESSSKYYIVFDELDEDYTSSASAEDRADYFALVTNLLKAVRLIRSDSRFKNVFPIVLLRDDIYNLLQDPDREKWMDWTISINWSENRIKELMAYRLCQAARVPLRSFDKIWKDLVGSAPSFTTPNKVWDKFDFITSYTLGRPRDYIYYLSRASKLICDRIERRVGSATLSQDVLRACVGPFATHLRRELEDEMSGQLPYIRDVMEIVLTFSGRHFRFDEFKIAYENARTEAREEWGDVESVLDTLYSFSAIGFVKPGGAEYYRYQSHIAELDHSRTMVLHKGLVAARRPS